MTERLSLVLWFLHYFLPLCIRYYCNIHWISSQKYTWCHRMHISFEGRLYLGRYFYLSEIGAQPWPVRASLQATVKLGGIFLKGPGSRAVRTEAISIEQRVTRRVLFHRTPKLHKSREQNESSASFDVSWKEGKRKLLTQLLQTSQSALQ